ncbi:MAG TPA: cytochrome c oxidase subunit II [Actinomycetota bacterium]|nr:cytochrome c oxidase subunit II [Actinomycetota bacterium]
MKGRRRISTRPGGRVAARLRAGACALTLLTAGCASEANSPSILRSSGLGALDVERLWWILFAISAAVFAIVMALVFVALVRRNRPPVQVSGPEEEVPWGGRFILLAGVVIPAVILTGTFALTLHEMSLLDTSGRHPAFTIQVIGHDWWWEARYPNGAVTANEIHIPTGQTVRVDLTTADVIHSFWVPQLQVKTDMIPGRSNHTWLRTSSPGRYRGQCAQFCGLQHAHMIFYVVADPPQVFQSWLAGQAAPAATPDTAQAAAGERTFLTSTCTGCHTIRGTGAAGVVGPDLTHLASRQTLAAGTLANTPGNLAEWITDPQHVKPGAEMPPTGLTPAQAQALVAYLESLH